MSERKHGMVIAIDGPSGAGKSTIARRLANRLGYEQIDTGAMYRAVSYLISQAGIDPGNMDAVERLCDDVEIRLDCSNGSQKVFANGQDVTSQIRTPEMSQMTSQISALKPVREALMKAQRKMGSKGGVVLEGRDIGTVVFPDAELKFYLYASPEERGRRRFAELITKGEKTTLDETIQAVSLRDEQDSQRDLAPLRQAEDAIPIDSSGVSVEDVLEIMEAAFRDKSAKLDNLLSC